jgi:hypothetical protein
MPAIEIVKIGTIPALAEHTRAIHELAKRTREDIIAIGRHLAEARELVEHGAWLDWINVEFGWSDQTARNFIHVYELSADPQIQNLVLNLDLPLKVLYQIAAPKAETARQELAERHEAGEEITRAAVEDALFGEPAADDQHGDNRRDRGGADRDGRDHRGGAGRARRSRYDPKHHAWAMSLLIGGLVDLLDEYPERFDAVLDHMLRDADIAAALARLVQQPKVQAAITGGPMLTALLDAVGVQGTLEAMSPEFGRELRGRLPKQRDDDGPHSKGEHDRLCARVEELGNEKRALEIKIAAAESIKTLAAAPAGNTSVDTTLPDDGSIPPFLRRTGPTDADKTAIADLESREAERTKLKTMNRIAKLKAKKSGELSKMPVQGKDALAFINANEAAS